MHVRTEKAYVWGLAGCAFRGRLFSSFFTCGTQVLILVAATLYATLSFFLSFFLSLFTHTHSHEALGVISWVAQSNYVFFFKQHWNQQQERKENFNKGSTHVVYSAYVPIVQMFHLILDQFMSRKDSDFKLRFSCPALGYNLIPIDYQVVKMNERLDVEIISQVIWLWFIAATEALPVHFWRLLLLHSTLIQA